MTNRRPFTRQRGKRLILIRPSIDKRSLGSPTLPLPLGHSDGYHFRESLNSPILREGHLTSDDLS